MAGRILTKIALSLAGLLLAAPAEAAVVDVTGTSAKLGWTAAAGAVTSYGVFVSRNGSAFPVSPDQVVATPEATVIAAAGDTLIVKVAAYDANGTKGPDSARRSSYLIYCWLRKHSLAWVSPFGHRRISVLAQLPVAYRSATRPSSALDAKASPVRP